MERVIKRYLMHNQGDSDDPKQNEHDELKQEVSIMKHELSNDMKKLKDESCRNFFKINGWMQILADEMIHSTNKGLGKESYLSYTRYDDLLRSQMSQSPSLSLSSPATPKLNSNTIGFNLTSEEKSVKGSIVAKLVAATDANILAVVNSIENTVKENTDVYKLSDDKKIKKPLNEEFFQTRLAYDFQTVFDED
jgi:hypothetical protein